MLGDVNCCPMKCFEHPIFNNRNPHAANVPHLTVGSNDPLGYVTATSLFMHRSDGFRHGSSVIGVDGGKILLKRREPFLRVKAENFIYLVRPIETQIVGPADAQVL